MLKILLENKFLIINRFQSWVLAFACLSFSATSLAVLPQSIDGQVVPSLAPMLDKVTPAVVNIATEGHVKVQTSPLMNDPFFPAIFQFA